MNAYRRTLAIARSRQPTPLTLGQRIELTLVFAIAAVRVELRKPLTTGTAVALVALAQLIHIALTH